MEHLQSLYQKYRPKKFEEIKGQNEIVNNLKKELAKEFPSQAFIFAGGRGTGKTSTARIFASYLETDISDIYEIDGATYNGVDQIREIIDNTRTLPNISKFKIYIIDEVHMLSKSAFNSLLKTLEEPPRHAIFILATTEPHKIPDTVISRCQFYQFKDPDFQILLEYIQEISAKENYKITDDASWVIALLGQGSYRNTLSVLQQVMLSTESKVIDSDLVSKQMGTPSTVLVTSFLEAVQNKDTKSILEIAKKIEIEKKDLVIFVSILIDKVQDILRQRYVTNKSSNDDWVKSMSGPKGSNINSKILLDLINLHLELEKTFFKQAYFEAYLIEKLTK